MGNCVLFPHVSLAVPLVARAVLAFVTAVTVVAALAPRSVAFTPAVGTLAPLGPPTTLPTVLVLVAAVRHSFS